MRPGARCHGHDHSGLEDVAIATVAADLSTAAGAAALVAVALTDRAGSTSWLTTSGPATQNQFGLGGFLDVGDEQWRDLFDLNLFSAVWMTRAALPSLLERRGAIMNVASINSRCPRRARSATARPRRRSRPSASG